MKKPNGFTLIELIVTVAIFGIMASIAVPSYSSFIRKNRQSSAYNNLVGTISLARTEAVKRSRVISLCISTDQATCNTSARNWNDGWIVFADLNGDGLVTTSTTTPADNDTVLRVESGGGSGITISSGDYPARLSIAPRGRLHTHGTFVICDSSNADENGKALNLWITGLGRLAADSNDDGIVEGMDGTNISCPTTP